MNGRDVNSCEKRVVDAVTAGGMELGRRVYDTEKRLNRNLDSFEDILNKYQLDV